MLRELPADPRSYNEFFGHGLRFAQPRDAVFIDRETLDTRRHVSQVRSHVQRSDVSLGQVANLLGYESQAAFSRAFRRWYDMTPRLARRPGAGFAPDPRRRPRIKLGATDE